MSLTWRDYLNGWRRTGRVRTFRGWNTQTVLIPYKTIFAEASGDAKQDAGSVFNQSVERIARFWAS